MEVKAHAKFVRISPKKVRLVANLVAGMKPTPALVQLKMTNKRSSLVIEKLLKSAMANAKHNFNVDPENMLISELVVNQGPTMKRYRPRAMGRAFIIRKKTSHISLTLSDEKGEKIELKKTEEKGEGKEEETKKTSAKKVEKKS